MKKLQTGTVKSAKMARTAVVVVSRLKEHPKYHKRTKVDKSFLADNEIGAKEGDKVVIEETRPLSHNKNHKIIKVITA